MDWLSANWLALTALVLAAFSTYWSTVRTRHRVLVTARHTSQGIFRSDGRVANHSWVEVTVSTIMRPVAVHAVTFEHADPGRDGHNISWRSLPVELTNFRQMLNAAGAGEVAVIPGMPPQGMGSQSHRLEDGASVTWACALGEPYGPDGPPAGKYYRAVVALADRRTIRSEPFWHAQTPEEGFFVPPDPG